MDEQNRQDAKNLHRELTRQIIGCAFEVVNDLGSGFLESVYEKAMMVALLDKGLSVESQKPIAVHFRGKSVGNFFADLLVEKKVIVELKAVKALTPEHRPDHQLLECNWYQRGIADQLWQSPARI